MLKRVSPVTGVENMKMEVTTKRVDCVRNEIALMVLIKGVPAAHQDLEELCGLDVSERTVRRIYEDYFEFAPGVGRAKFVKAAMFEFLSSTDCEENVYPHIEDVYRKLTRTAKHRLDFWSWSEDFLSFKQRKPGDWWRWFSRWNSSEWDLFK